MEHETALHAPRSTSGGPAAGPQEGKGAMHAVHTSGLPATGATGMSWRLDSHEHGYPEPLLDLIAGRFRLLGEPLRLKLLAALAAGERSVGELVTLTGASQPNVSKHLGALSAGGLVQRRKAGTTIYYTLADTSVLALCDAVCSGVQQRFAAQASALGFPPVHPDGRQEQEQER